MNFLLLYNPVSGRINFEKHLHTVKRHFKKTDHTLEIYESKAAGDLKKVALARAKDFDAYIVAGGDGTLNEVLNGIMHSDVRPAIGLLPSGTANDTAAILGMNRNICRSLNIFFRDTPSLIDINQINDQYFIYTAAAGILTRVSYDVSRRHIKKYGYFAYVLAAMQDFAKDYRFPIHIKYNGEEIDCECVMVLGLSSNRVGGMRLYQFSQSKLNDGLFELRLFTRIRKFWRFRLLSSLIRGGKKLREDYHLIANHFEIQTDPEIGWNADGEFSTKGNVTIQVHQQAVRMFTSKRTKKKYF